uniref:DUF4939 domain-containing protein n=1 Tax=Sander lucioperca TaxID=283035 RepID=A0A8D0CZC9_SANLU
MAEALRSQAEEVRHLGSQPHRPNPLDSSDNVSQPASPPCTSAVNPVPPAVAPSSLESPVSFPEKFSGVLGTCEGFLVQCALVFRRQTATFRSEEARVCFVAGLLRDRALAWFTLVSEGQPHLLSSYSAFVEEMRRVFDRPTSGCWLTPLDMATLLTQCPMLLVKR